MTGCCRDRARQRLAVLHDDAGDLFGRIAEAVEHMDAVTCGDDPELPAPAGSGPTEDPRRGVDRVAICGNTAGNRAGDQPDAAGGDGPHGAGLRTFLEA